MEIIIKKSERFHTHTNRELKDRTGKPMRFYSERDYTSELKKRGLERFNENKYKPFQPKKYEGVSDEARQMMNSVSYDKNGKPNIGDRYIDKLKSMGSMKPVPKEVLDKSSGGFYGKD